MLSGGQIGVEACRHCANLSESADAAKALMSAAFDRAHPTTPQSLPAPEGGRSRRLLSGACRAQS
jgi:hypothetical protein